VPVLRHKKITAFPRHPDAPPVNYQPLSWVLSRAYPTDVHFCAYSCPEIERRLDSGFLDGDSDVDVERAYRNAERRNVKESPVVRMVIAAFDLDAPGHQFTADWLNDQCEKLGNLFDAHPGGFAYRTRNGLRLVYRLASPFPLKNRNDARRWSKQYI